MIYDTMPLDEISRLFIDTGLRSFAKSDDLDLDKEVAKIAEAIVARGDAGAAVLRPLLADPREQIQFLSAAWLSELDPQGASPTFERLEREAIQFEISAFARLKLLNNCERGLLPAL